MDANSFHIKGLTPLMQFVGDRGNEVLSRGTRLENAPAPVPFHSIVFPKARYLPIFLAGTRSLGLGRWWERGRRVAWLNSSRSAGRRMSSRGVPWPWKLTACESPSFATRGGSTP